LIDSDGYVNKTGLTDFCNTNIQLVQQTRELIESLGYKSTYQESVSKLYGKECAPIASVKFKPREHVCKLKYKSDRIVLDTTDNSRFRNRWHYIKSVTPIKSVPVRCITVDSADSLFLVGRQYIPTHNTTIATIYILWHALFNSDQHILVVANKEETAKEIFGRVQLAFEELPNWLKGGVKEYGKEGMQLANGSKIKITTTTTNAGRGSSCNLLFIDEADWIEHGLLNSFWSSVYPIISSSKKSKIIMASTPRDTAGIFYRLYRKSISDDPENVWKSLVVKWYDVPGRDEAWAQQARSGMDDPTRFRVEFECEFEETGDSTISDTFFEKLKRRCSEPIHIYMDGQYKLWDQPDRNHLYVVGVDVAEGVGQDSTVVQVIDVTDLRQINQVATFASNTITPSEFTPKLYEILQQWGMPLLLSERNSCGAQVVDNLRKDFQYEGIVSHGAREIGRTKIPLGVISHSNTKYDCIINMRYWMNTMDAVQINDVKTVEELKDFIRYPNGSWKARQGKHDDRVMSLGWGLMVLSEKIVNKYFEVITQDENHRPAVIKPLDYGVKYFINPSSMYVDEVRGDVDVLPSLLGSSSFNADIDDLQSMGWQFMQ
jgi:hypothetical protein